MINKSSQIPAYLQLKSIILDNIEKGIWKEGNLISSERELSERFLISRMTIRQALGELVQEGFLIKKKGKGTYVCRPKVTQKDIMSFTEIIEKTGGKLENIILNFDVIKTPKFLHSMFSEDTVYKIDRNRVVDGEIIANELIYMPYSLGKDLTEENIKDSIYKYLESRNHHISYCDSSINAILYNDDFAKLFELDDKVALLNVNNKVYSQDDKILFYEKAIYRSDKYTLEVNIYKREGKLK